MRKDSLNVGDKVRALRMHNKAVAVEGTIRRIHESADDCVDIDVSSAGGVPVKGEFVETVHVPDVTVLEQAEVKKKK